MSKSPLSDLGGDRLKEMEKIHAMEVEEVGKCMYILYTRTCTCIYRHTCTYTCALYMHIVYCMLHMYMYLYNIQSNVCYTCTCTCITYSLMYVTHVHVCSLPYYVYNSL